MPEPDAHLSALRDLWAPSGVYLNTATYGLPPRPGWEALQAALDAWRGGVGDWERWGEAVDEARRSFAQLVRVPPSQVAVGSTLSAMAGLVAAALPDGARVLAPEEEFTSNLFPWMVHADRGIQVRTVPAARIAEAIDARTTLVALSAVQSASGAVADLDAVAAAARSYGAAVFVDATQACGWLPLDAGAVDFLACAAYKWLMAPRGTAFIAVAPAWLERVRPTAAGWFAGEDVHTAYYGPPLRLAQDARRLDISPAWFSWVGAAPALRLLLDVGVERIQAHDVALANRFLRGRGLPAGRSAIVTVEAPDAAERLERAGVRCAVRAGRVRASFHLYNGQADVDRALNALDGAA